MGNIVQAMVAYAEGKLGDSSKMPLISVDRIIAIGCSDPRMDVRSLHQQVIPQQEPSLQALINKALFSDTKLLVRRSARVLEFATATLNVKLMR